MKGLPFLSGRPWTLCPSQVEPSRDAGKQSTRLCPLRQEGQETPQLLETACWGLKNKRAKVTRTSTSHSVLASEVICSTTCSWEVDQVYRWAISMQEAICKVIQQQHCLDFGELCSSIVLGPLGVFVSFQNKVQPFSLSLLSIYPLKQWPGFAIITPGFDSWGLWLAAQYLYACFLIYKTGH